MNLESMATSLGRETDRRSMLKKLAGGGMGLAGALGLGAASAEAYHTGGGGHFTSHGCNLCYPKSTCSYTCAWCWWGGCHRHNNGVRYQHKCCEGYGPVSPSYCDGNCRWGLLKCSFNGGRRRC